MSGSVPLSGIFMTDTPKEIEKKIKTQAFSGGGATKEEHIEKGANLEVDISYHYLRFFMKDEKNLERIATEYKSGRMMTGEVKKTLIGVLQEFIGEHQVKRKAVTDEMIKKFLSLAPRKWIPK